MPEDHAWEEAVFDLELVWQVRPRWQTRKAIYVGVVPKGGDMPVVKHVMRRAHTGELEEHTGEVASITARCSRPWVRLADSSVSDGQINLTFAIDRAPGDLTGPQDSELQVTVNYGDGTQELYTSRVYAYFKE